MNAPLSPAATVAAIAAEAAAAKGFTLDSKFTLEEGAIYLTGTQSLVRLMLDQRRLDQRAGLNTAGFVCGYPGSPLGGVDHEMARNRTLLDAHHVVHLPGLNEELAATAAYGTQTVHDIPGARYDGVYAMWFGKSPGVDRAADAFQHHNWRGVGRNGGVLCVAGDDPQARSTNYPSDSNTIFYKLYMPLLAPGNIQEVLDFGLHGYALSRAAGLWVGFKFVTDIADTAATAQVGPERVQPVLPQVLFDGQPLAPSMRTNDVGPVMLETERRIFHGQLEIARRYAALNGLNRIVADPPRARLGLVSCGKTYYDLRQALDGLGLDEGALHSLGIRILKMGLIYPVEPDIVRRFAEGLEEILVVEDKRAFLELFIKDILYPLPARPRVTGKTDAEGLPLLPVQGELSPDAIARAVLARLRAMGQDAPAAVRSPVVLPRAPIMLSTTRLPYFCSGCPHNSSLKAPEDAIVGAGIGCHIMALWMPPSYGRIKGYTQMGGEGAQWVGLAPFTDTRHIFQNLGDGTFAHSGSLAIRFAVAAGSHITYKILYNSTIAMTGGQDILGGMAVPEMVKMLEAEGVKRILVTTDDLRRYPGRRVGSAEVWPRERLLEAEQLLAASDGVTVLLHDQHCAAQKRRLRKRGKLAYKPVSAFINQRVCEGCGDCGEKSNCLSVQPVATEFGRKTAIHQSSCNQDLSCLKGDCPSFATVEVPVELAHQQGQQTGPPRARLPFPADVQLAEPVLVVPADRFSMCLTGIGGTGVVTVTQILGTAAFRSGLRVQTYDQTGASQKAGPVVSHLKLLPPGIDGAPTVGIGSADLYLVFDPLVGVSANNLAVASPERTVAIVSTTEVPTGEMVANKARLYPPARQLRDALDGATRSQLNVYLDAQQLAEALLGDHMASNLLLVGVALQSGALPIPAAAIEEAIRLNGTAVDMNLQAFRWGRLQAADPARVAAALAQAQPAAPVPAPAVLDAAAAALVAQVEAPAELRRLLEVRVPELIAFQNAALAQRYLAQVQAVRRAEQRVVGERTALSEAVARNLYKLMACKDEYEVARLLLDQAELARLQKAFGAAARVRWHLHPTFLRALGVRDKVALGAWFKPVLQLLRFGKRLRGTPLDLFARTTVRRVDAALLAHYETLLAELCARLQPASYDAAVRLAALPDQLRGYEHVRLRSVRGYLAALEDLAPQAGLPVPAWPPVLAAQRAAAAASPALAQA